MEIRARYAPSPTGFLHVGGLRTALYNFLFCRRHHGRFILRIEDTDRARRVDGAVENLLAAFCWLGLDFDEGPQQGGAYGPYVQSERLELYAQHAAQLADSGHAYPCFCSPETLERMRAEQSARSAVPRYDRRCRGLAPAAAQSRIAAGEPHVWRMAVPDGRTIVIKDLIRGDVQFDSSGLDDQVLIKSDGFPTYHLANVVDDHHMRISHVIRGEEWLPSTPKHALLYEFFGWEPPQFAHLPLLLNPDRSKMSKRAGDVAVEAYRERGILPAVLLNFVALLGWHPSDDRELFTLEQLVNEFSLERVNKAGAVFDQAKLAWLNTEYVKAETDDQLLYHLRDDLAPLLTEHGADRVRYALATVRGGASSYADAAQRVADVFAPTPSAAPEMRPLLEDAAARACMTNFAARLAELDEALWTDFPALETAFKQAAADAGSEHGLKGKALWTAVRAALTGQPHGPELAKLPGIWGRARVLAQLGRLPALSPE